MRDAAVPGLRLRAWSSAVVLAASLLLAGCGGRSEVAAQESVARAQEASADAAATASLEREMRAAYGADGLNASWYSLISDIQVTAAADYVQVEADVADQQTADDICGATLAALDAAGSSVEVFTPEGQRVSDCART